MNSGSLVLVNMLCVAFLAHYNAINYSKELDQSTPHRYGLAIASGFGIALSIFGLMMFVGYSLFGSSALPLILNNFPKSSDYLATIARIAIGFSIVVAYPLMFAGLKSSMIRILKLDTPVDSMVKENKQISVKDNQINSKKSIKTVAITTVLIIITSIAIKCGEEDVSLVLGIVGSVIGCSVAYVLPGFLGLLQMRLRKKQGLKNSLREVIINHLLVALGSLFGLLGVWITIKTETESHHLH